MKTPSFFRRLKRRPIWLASIIAVVGLIIAGLAAKPAYHLFRDWRIERNARGAGEALAVANYPEARRLAMSVLRFRKDRYDMLVVLRQAMERLNDPEAVNVAKMLMAHPEATEADRIRGFTEICAQLPIAVATRTWRNLGKERAASPDYLVPFAARVIDQGLPEEAAKVLIPRPDLEQQPELRLQAVRVLLVAQKGRYVDRAQFEIAELMDQGGATGLAAYRMLAGVPVVTFRSAYFPDLKKWISSQDGATIDDHLLAYIQRLHRLPGRQDEIVTEAIDQFAKQNPAAVARWLLRLGRADQALALLPDTESAGDLERYRARANALIALRRWQDGSQWLASSPEGFPLIELQAGRVICEDVSGDPGKRGKAWNEALREAGAQGSKGYLELRERMQEAGLEDHAREAMVEAVRQGRGRLPFWAQIRDLLPWLYQRRQAQPMFEVASVMASLEPGNPEIAVEALDIACILGKIETPALLEQVGELRKKFPSLLQSSRYRQLEAKAQLLNQNPSDALESLATDASDLAAAGNRVLALCATAHAIGGEDQKATAMLQQVAWDRMLREEREFFSRVLNRPGSAGGLETVSSRFDTKLLPYASRVTETDASLEILPPLIGNEDAGYSQGVLPSLGDEFAPQNNPNGLPPISDSINAEFKSKEPTPISDAIKAKFQPTPIKPLEEKPEQRN